MASLCNPCTIGAPLSQRGLTFPRSGSIQSVLPAKRLRRAGGVVVRAETTSSSPFEGIINGITVFLNNSPLNAGKKALAVAQAGQYDAVAVKAKVEKLIADNPVMVFSWIGCPFCKKAKALLDSVGAKYTALELDQMGPEGTAIRAELAKMTNRTSMPNIFIKGQGVGGCNDGPGVLTLQKNGQLMPMLKAAGAV